MSKWEMRPGAPNELKLQAFGAGEMDTALDFQRAVPKRLGDTARRKKNEWLRRFRMGI